MAVQVPELTVVEARPPAWRRPFWAALLLSSITAAVSVIGLCLFSYARLQEREGFSEQLQLLNDQNVDLLEEQRDVSADLAAERAEDDTELLEDRCESAYTRRITRVQDRVNSAEAESFVALSRLGPESAEYMAASDRYAAETVQFSAAVSDRDGYIAGGRQLPCPISD